MRPTEGMRYAIKSAGQLDRLPIFTVYQSPRDFPGRIVVRVHHVLRGKSEPTATYWLYMNIDAARRDLDRAGLQLIARSDEDDPCIVESWL